MSILHAWPRKLRLLSALIAAIALLTLSLGSALAHHAAGTGTDASATQPVWLTSLTDNGDVDEDDTNEVEPPNAEDDNGDVDEESVDQNDQGDSADENDQGEDDSSADENDQGQDENAGDTQTRHHADQNDDSDSHDGAHDGNGGGDDENDDSGDEGGDD